MPAFSILTEHLCASEDEGKELVNAVNTIAGLQVDKGRPGLISMHVWRPFGKKKALLFRLLQTFASESEYNTFSVDKDVVKHAAPLVSSAARAKQRTLVVGSNISKSLMAATQHQNPLYTPVTHGYVLHRRPAFRTFASAGNVGLDLTNGNDDDDDDVEDDAVLVELILDTKESEEKALGAKLDALLSRKDAPATCLSAIVVDGGFEAAPAGDQSAKPASADSFPLYVVLVFANSEACGAVLNQAFWELVQNSCDAVNVCFRCTEEAAALQRAMHDAVKYGDKSFNIESNDRVHLAKTAGYVLHCGLMTGDLDVEVDAEDGDEAANAADDKSKSGGAQGDSPFAVKFASDGVEPRTFTFKRALPKSETTKTSVTINLLELVKKLTGLRGTELPAENLFCQLGRLRALDLDIQALNDFTSSPKDGALRKDGAAKHRAECVLQNLAAFGWPLPSPDASVSVPFLSDLVKELEQAYAYLIVPAREALNADKTVVYKALMEYYHIGDIILFDAPPLGGTTVAARVCDIYYDSVRSVFGGKKLSFHIAVELIVHMGDTYAFVSFDEPVGDWEGRQAITNLPYKVLDVEAKAQQFKTLRERGQHLLSLGLKPAYRQYRASCFFAHGGAMTVASAQLNASGRLVVDTARGMGLGHLVAPGHEPVSLAVQGTVRAYRAVQRGMAEGEPGAKTTERIQSAGLRLMKTVPPELAHAIWPAVVGFSLGTKRWGHVLVDGLCPIAPRLDAWDRLVLSKSKKELLLALVHRHFDKDAPRLKDLVSNKGDGCLFLLHGPPGVGKTLSVEALSEKFGLPLYFLTFGELGTSVTELEARLGDALSLCAGWGAIVLLDEGDALVERREKGALVLNSLTSTFLKALDGFEGLLFLTTNRVGSFDPAALSRVTLAIRYSALKDADRQKVWHNVLERASADPNDFDLAALAKRGGSGRDINANARLALALAHHRKKSIDQELLLEVMDIADDFKRDFGDGLKGYADAGRVSDSEEE